MATRLERVKRLEATAKEYVAKEKTRIENEVKVLEDILSGRTAGAGIQTVSRSVVEAVANNDLASYLKGG